MTTTAVETPEKLVVEYQKTGSAFVFRAIYDYLEQYCDLTFTTMQQILPETLLDSGELSVFADDSIFQAIKSYNSSDSQGNFLSHYLATVKDCVEGVKRYLTARVCSVSEIYFYAVANSLPESATDLWEKQWRMTVDELCQFKDDVKDAVIAFSSYKDSSSLHKQWAHLLAWESTEFLGYSAYVQKDAQELQQARDSFRAYFQEKQRQESAAEQLHQLARQYQVEGGTQLFNAIYENAAIVEVAEEYRSYMADPDSYCNGQAVIYCDFIEMILENALEAAVMELPEGAELPAVYGSYIMAEFEYFILQVERETENTASKQV